jgi:hypothetical protein
MLVTMKSTIFWDVRPCSLVEVYSILKKHTASLLIVKCLLLTLQPEDGGSTFLQTIIILVLDLKTSHKTVLFKD